MTVHMLPPEGQVDTPCCGKSLIDLPVTAEFSVNPEVVTCGAAAPHPHVEQLAMFMAHRDNHESGTAPWAKLGPDAHESYRKDARAVLAAILALGWNPPEGTA